MPFDTASLRSVTTDPLYLKLKKDILMSGVELKDWSIQTFYDARDDKGALFRATAVYHCKAEGIKEAYDDAENSLGPDHRLGAILPGKHLRFP